jgi:abhydrolase domain-containing protein 12
LAISFVDVATLVTTYRIVGTIPILSPLAKFPRLFAYLRTFIRDKWSTKDCIIEYIKANEANGQKYQLTIIHAEDDYNIPWHHTPTIVWHAVNATVLGGISFQELEENKNETKIDIGAAGLATEWRTKNGVIWEEILKYGLHDIIMGNPVIIIAVMRIFGAGDPSFE